MKDILLSQSEKPPSVCIHKASAVNVRDTHEHHECKAKTTGRARVASQLIANMLKT